MVLHVRLVRIAAPFLLELLWLPLLLLAVHVHTGGTELMVLHALGALLVSLRPPAAKLWSRIAMCVLQTITVMAARAPLVPLIPPHLPDPLPNMIAGASPTTTETPDMVVWIAARLVLTVVLFPLKQIQAHLRTIAHAQSIPIEMAARAPLALLIPPHLPDRLPNMIAGASPTTTETPDMVV